MNGPLQANKVAEARPIPKRGGGRREEEDFEQQQQPIPEHPTGECARQATKGEIPFEKLISLRDIMMSSVISHLDGELNPRPAYNSGVYFEHSRFCEDCLDKVTTAIMEGLRKEKWVMTNSKKKKKTQQFQ